MRTANGRCAQVASTRHTKSTTVASVPGMTSYPVLAQELRLKDVHYTFPRQGGNHHQTFVFEDRTKIGLYPTSLRIDTAGSGALGDSLSFLGALPPLVEHMMRMVKSLADLPAEHGYVQLLHGNLSYQGLELTARDRVPGDRDVVLDGDSDEYLWDLAIRPEGIGVPTARIDERVVEIVSPFDNGREIVVACWPIG